MARTGNTTRPWPTTRPRSSTMRSRRCSGSPDGRLVCTMRTHVNPSSDAKNMVVVVSEDDGFSWTPPKWTNIWGYPSEMIPLQDGRYLMIYGYRRPPYGVRGCVSEDGVTWDAKNEFVIREGGVPGQERGASAPGSSRHEPVERQVRQRLASTGRTPASTSTSAIRASCSSPTGRSSPPTTSGARTSGRCSMSAARASGLTTETATGRPQTPRTAIVLRDEHGYCRPPPPRPLRRRAAAWSATGRPGAAVRPASARGPALPEPAAPLARRGA